MIEKLGGRKAVALWAALLVALVLLIGNRWLLPDDLARATMVTEQVLSFLIWTIGIFVGGNAMQHVGEGVARVAKVISGRTPPQPPPV